RNEASAASPPASVAASTAIGAGAAAPMAAWLRSDISGLLQAASCSTAARLHHRLHREISARSAQRRTAGPAVMPPARRGSEAGAVDIRHLQRRKIHLR